MLGRLARYLRLLGYDVSYPESFPDKRLIALARSQGRILLTRDRAIARSESAGAGNPHVMEITSGRVIDQILQLAEEGWIGRVLAPRCSRCNTLLEEIGQWEARHLLPPFTQATQLSSLYCPSCNSVLWEGSHWEHFRGMFSRGLLFD